jgi:phthiodiolone/phenolphthiodiolone dimycocerosates ketoreductase
VAQVPPSLMREMCLTGAPDEIIDQAAIWRDRGLRYVVVLNASALHPKMRKGMAAAGIPTLTVLRGLKKL